MTSLSVLFIAILCVLYINTHISGVDSRPPDNLPISAHKDDVTDETSHREHKQIVPMLRRKFTRLPSICRRLRRRRITILCNTAKFCSARRHSLRGHVCSCPKGSKCKYFFLWSL
ncbi:cocaine- and amphetamine-regulated transcript protein isoform X1 [Triplophysa dalaica]|uniref:cocaine- and amphetamine-regulated transcript protein isoform X1 n=1 Tax=Triplophysa dalaica TaxID=1582913 RepID=UPI0024DFC2FB|nr:cocaine- and amphetamine-regulated transcript protein isoform X1 [Triplophysa dalaica]